MGEEATVYGHVAGTYDLLTEEGRPTLLDFDWLFPLLTFNVVIWEADREAFPSPPESMYLERELCVTGRIELYDRKPAIVAKSPTQIRVIR